MDVLAARTFLAALETGSFAGAAVRLNTSASTVTERIKQLESQLEARLFDRDRNGCRLTAAGQRFVDAAFTMVRVWEDARNRVALPSRFTRTLKVGCQFALASSILFPLVAWMRREHPEVALHAGAGAQRELVRSLADGQFDVAIIYEPVVPRGLWAEKIADDHLILVNARPDLPWHSNFIRLGWGEVVESEIARHFGSVPYPGLQLELGAYSLTWLVEAGASGLIPRRLATEALVRGEIVEVPDMPVIAFSPYLCGKDADDWELAMAVLEFARGIG